MKGTPKRVRMRRAAGWRKPEGTIYVGRPTRWGNPFPLNGEWMMWTAVGLGLKADRVGRRQAAVLLHRAWITGGGTVERALDQRGGYLEFGDGSTVSLADHAANIALAASTLYEAPRLPGRPELAPLRGHDLACWCPLELPCHADVLLELANTDPEGGE